jgi:hypothetical protein
MDKIWTAVFYFMSCLAFIMMTIHTRKLQGVILFGTMGIVFFFLFHLVLGDIGNEYTQRRIDEEWKRILKH